MAESTDTRVAVYIDFDNIVISRFSQVNGDRQRKIKDLDPTDAATARMLEDANVDLGAVLDFASSFGTVAVSRAYADWSVPANSTYRQQLIDRAVDLIQLFPVTKAGKNGSDIRLALDVADDLFRFPHLTHVVIVAGDSDYIALAQRCKQLGRYVVGIGVAGSVSAAFKSACNEFKDYDALPGVTAPPKATAKVSSSKATQPKAAKSSGAADLLLRAFDLTQAKNDEEWQSIAVIKTQMLRLDPTFQESALGFRSFTDFAQSLSELVELDDGKTNRKMRLVSSAPASVQTSVQAPASGATKASTSRRASRPAKAAAEASATSSTAAAPKAERVWTTVD